MPSLNFKARFAGRVSDGSKRRTIRAWRKRPFQAGDTLLFFTGMRTKQCRRLRPNAPCIAATAIEIHPRRRRVMLDQKRLGQRQIDELARHDGFANTAEFWEFFAKTHGPVLRGQLIEWRP